ncbi:TorF family putative porin [Achromobacter denitrificans]|uniref:TorF family putative porin n=1 Tax=Achromobacter denitrificans TaxID=32002 RepID=UPI0023E42144|nr:TorF family putative porin [Achromobacter denitrificans]MDF3940168.1 TorF family putative porin [Achromobacter denitrificans]
MSRPTLAALALLTLAAAQAGGALAADAPATTPETEAPAEASGQALTANLTLASQYRYRGLMQSNGKPAVQGGFDFTHASGFYLGNWNSSISWLNDGNDAVSAPVEMDFYGGYKGQLAPNVPVDLGVLQYYYPGDYPSGYTSPDTTELYAGIGYGPLMFKYSIALTNLFGFADSKYSQYFDLSGNLDTGVWGLILNAHVGRQAMRNVDDGSYTDWKLGVTKDFGQGLSVSLAYLDTNADRAVYTNTRGRDMGRATGLLSLTKTF